MLKIEAVRGCISTPRILFALEEMGIPLELTFRDSGYFIGTFGVSGPLLRDGDLEVLGIGAILRHIGRAYGAGRLVPSALPDCARLDRWLDFSLFDLGPSMGRVASILSGPPERRHELPEAYAAAMRLLSLVETQLGSSGFLLANFSIFECTFAPLLLAPQLLPEGKFSVLRDYVKRLSERPAWSRVLARLAT